MKAFFDSSVLVPVFYGDHEHHGRSIAAFKKYGRAEACCGAHTLAEVYSALTRMPGRHRISAEQAILFIENVHERLTVVSLDAEEYWHGLKKFADLRNRGKHDLRCDARVLRPQGQGSNHLQLEHEALPTTRARDREVAPNSLSHRYSRQMPRLLRRTKATRCSVSGVGISCSILASASSSFRPERYKIW